MSSYFEFNNLQLAEIPYNRDNPQLFANYAAPYVHLSDRRFEELLYLLFKQKMEREEHFQERHNRIQIMQGVGEQGRDCALFKGSKFSGIIQCKNHKAPVDAPSSLEEIAKPLLHAIMGDLVISDPFSFEYFLVAGKGFTGPANSMLSDMKTYVDEHEEEVQKAVRKLKKKYAAFSKVDYPAIRIELLALLRAIRVLQITGLELDVELHHPGSDSIRNAFFTTLSVTDTSEIKKLREEIKGQNLAVDPATFQLVQNRTDEIYKALTGLKESLGDIINPDDISKNPDLANMLDRIVTYERELIDKYAEKELYERERKDFPESKSAVKASEIANGEYLAIQDKLSQEKRQMEAHICWIKSARRYFYTINQEEASGRLKQAKLHFEDGEYEKGLQLLNYEGREKDIEDEIAAMEINNARIRSLSDEEVLLAMHVLKRTNDLQRFNIARKHFENSLALCTNEHNCYEYALFLKDQNEFDRAIEVLNYSLSRTKEDGDYKAMILNALGLLLKDRGDRNAAKLCLYSAIDMYRKLAEENATEYLLDLANTLNNAGLFSYDQKDNFKAIEFYTEALGIYQKVLKDKPGSYRKYFAYIYQNLGNLHRTFNQDRDKAREYWEQALTIFKELAEVDPDNYQSDIASVLNVLGILEMEERHFDNALTFYSAALKITRRLTASNDISVLNQHVMLLNNIGNLYQYEQNYEEAILYHKEALSLAIELCESKAALYYALCANTHNNIGISCLLKDPHVALEHHEEALDIFRQLTEVTPDVYMPDIARTLAYMGICLKTMSEKERALSCYTASLQMRGKLVLKDPISHAAHLKEIMDEIRELLKPKDSQKEIEDLYKSSLQITDNSFSVLTDVQLEKRAEDYMQPIMQLMAHGNPIAGKVCTEEVLRIYILLSTRDPKKYLPIMADTLSSIGVFFLGYNVEQSRSYSMRGLDILRKTENTSKVSIVKILHTLFLCCIVNREDVEKVREANVYFEEALSIYAELVRAEDPDIVDSFLGFLHNVTNSLEVGDEEMAYKCYRELKRLSEPQIAGKQGKVDKLLHRLAYYGEKMINGDLVYFRELLNVRRRLVDQDPNGYLIFLYDTLIKTSRLLKESGQLKESFELFEEAIITGERLAAKDNSVYKKYLFAAIIDLYFDYCKQEQYESASVVLKKALDYLDSSLPANPQYLELSAQLNFHMGETLVECKQDASAKHYFRKSKQYFSELGENLDERMQKIKDQLKDAFIKQQIAWE